MPRALRSIQRLQMRCGPLSFSAHNFFFAEGATIDSETSDEVRAWSCLVFGRRTPPLIRILQMRCVAFLLFFFLSGWGLRMRCEDEKMRCEDERARAPHAVGLSAKCTPRAPMLYSSSCVPVPDPCASIHPGGH